MIDYKELGKLEINSDDFDEPVSFEYFFKLLLKELWIEEEGFSGKRPFGNSGWTYCIYKAMSLAGYSKYKSFYDEDDNYLDVYDFDKVKLDKIILSYIEQLN